MTIKILGLKGLTHLFILTVCMRGIFEREEYFPSLIMVTENFAFKSGSSKHGNAARAKVASNSVAAR